MEQTKRDGGSSYPKQEREKEQKREAPDCPYVAQTPIKRRNETRQMIKSSLLARKLTGTTTNKAGQNNR